MSQFYTLYREMFCENCGKDSTLFFFCYIEIVSTRGQQMLAGFIRKTKYCAGQNRRFAQTHRIFCSAPTHTHSAQYPHKTDVSPRHIAFSAPHQHTNTHTIPTQKIYRKERVRHITFTAQSHCSLCLQ